jgi:carboxymethylenebutenolidase
MEKVEIATKDGTCPSYVFTPKSEGGSEGSWPAVLLYMDGLAIRPALFEMAERIAAHGYVVLLPDLFYRSGPYEPFDPKTVFSDPDKRKELVEKFISKANVPNVMRDTEAFLAFLAARADVKPSAGVGTVGYCMGGPLSLAAAGTFPDRVVAAASYHGSRLASDAPESPHLLAPKMRARVYVAAATDDPNFPDDMKARLVEALRAANVDHVVETYPAKHGWVPRDTPVHDPACAERHWQTLFALFDAKLKA